jgi:hypothetical protein
MRNWYSSLAVQKVGFGYFDGKKEFGRANIES